MNDKANIGVVEQLYGGNGTTADPLVLPAKPC